MQQIQLVQNTKRPGPLIYITINADWTCQKWDAYSILDGQNIRGKKKDGHKNIKYHKQKVSTLPKETTWVCDSDWLTKGKRNRNKEYQDNWK